jgi:hypothetical protein
MRIFLIFLAFICCNLNVYASQYINKNYYIFNKTPDSIVVSYKYCKNENGVGSSHLSDCQKSEVIEISPMNIGKVPVDSDYHAGIIVTSIKSDIQTVNFADDIQALEMAIHQVPGQDIMQCFLTSVNRYGAIEKIIDQKFTCKFEYIH